jgi:hemolysin III
MVIRRETTLSRIRESQQEVANSITHGLGLLLSIVASLFVAFTFAWPDYGMAFACGVYGLSLVIVYTVSTLSHAIQNESAKHHLRAWDQGVIYWLIAGTYTPFAWASLEDTNRVLMLTSVWTFAILGFCSKVLGYHRINSFSSLSYVLLGWIPGMILVWTVPFECAIGMVAGGLAYTLGIVFLINDHRQWYFHALWHVAVIAGSACHFYAIVRLLLALKTMNA